MAHLVLTGPVTGIATLADGTRINITPGAVEVSSKAEADELAHLIGLRYQAEGHPDDIEVDDETGELVQRPFEYVVPAEFANYKPLEG